MLSFQQGKYEEKFLLFYIEKVMISRNPSQRLEHNVIDKIMKIVTDSGKNIIRDLVLGVCGKHEGVTSSMEFL